MIKDMKAFLKGLALAVTFAGILILIFSPVFGPDREGKPRNGLQYSDSLFNRLAKGSSYFIPKLKEEKLAGLSSEPVSISVKLKEYKGADPEKDAKLMDNAVRVLTISGARAQAAGDRINITGDLKALLDRALADSDSMYHNEGAQMAARYSAEEKDAKPLLRAWWNILESSVKELQKQGKNKEAEVVSQVNKKAVEPAYNFYKIQAQKVSERAFTLLGVLVFYVAYTLWWGFAIYFMFEGLGLSTKKAKVKKEV